MLISFGLFYKVDKQNVLSDRQAGPMLMSSQVYPVGQGETMLWTSQFDVLLLIMTVIKDMHHYVEMYYL